MPSYTLDNWDGGLSGSAKQACATPPTSANSNKTHHGLPSIAKAERKEKESERQRQKSNVGYEHESEHECEDGIYASRHDGMKEARHQDDASLLNDLTSRNGDGQIILVKSRIASLNTVIILSLCLLTPIPLMYVQVSTDALLTLEAGKRQRMFVPIASSPLHAIAQKSKSPTKLALTLKPTIPASPSPSSSRASGTRKKKPSSRASGIHRQSHVPEVEVVDTLPTYTADAECEDEDGDIIVVANMLSEHIPHSRTYDDEQSPPSTPHLSSKPSHPPSQDTYPSLDHLFTPSPGQTHDDEPSPPTTPPPHQSRKPHPPLQDTYRSLDRLFTPSPTPPPLKHAVPLRQRHIMSHVLIPPLTGPKAAYKRLPPLVTNINVNTKKVAPAVVGHRSIEDALQASLVHNAGIGILPYSAKRVEREKKLQAMGSGSGSGGGGAGDSASVIVKKRKRPRSNEGESVGRKEKRSRIIDLTLSDDDIPLALSTKKPKLIPVPPQPANPPRAHTHTHTRYDAGQDLTRLYCGDVEPMPEVVALNTRFIPRTRTSGVGGFPSGNDASLSDGVGREAMKVVGYGGNGRGKGKMGFGLPVDRFRSSDEEGEGEYWVGAGVREEVEESSDSDSDVVIVSNPAHQLQRRTPVPLHPPPPPRIDLAKTKAQNQKKRDRQQSQSVEDLTTLTSLPTHSSPHSRPPHTRNSTSSHHTLDSDSDAEYVYHYTGVPSAKALGKRRAVSPCVSQVHSQAQAQASAVYRLPLPGSPGPPGSPDSSYINAGAGNEENGELDGFLTHTSFDPPLAAHTSDAHLDAVLGLYHPSHSQSEDGHINNVHAAGSSTQFLSHTPRTDAVGVGAFTSGSIFKDLEVPDLDRPWPTLFDETAQYAFETIDPTLLGPLSPDLDLDLDLRKPETESSGSDLIELELEYPEPYSPSSPSLSSPSSSSSNEALPRSILGKASELEKAPGLLELVIREEDDHEALSDNEDGDVYVPRRQRIQRHMQDMVNIEDVDLSSSPSPSSSSPGYDTPPASHSDYVSDVDEEVVVSKPKSIPLSTPKPKPSKKAVRQPQEDFPMEDVDTYCHQCRRKTFYLKMICVCTRIYCVRCIVTRYPDREFNMERTSQPHCPSCEGYCNCTVCCLKRGDVYVGTRTKTNTLGAPRPGSRPKPLLKARPGRERVRLGGKTNLPPLIANTVLPISATIFGALYDLTGRRMGTGFVDSAGEGAVLYAPTVSMVQQQQAQPTKMPKPKPPKPKKKHIFVGAVQPSWRVGRNPIIKEKNALPRRKKLAGGKGTGIYPGVDAVEKTRFFIGDPAFLRRRVKTARSDYCELGLDELSPLSSLEDTDEEAEDIDEGKSFSPDSLEDGDVTRAIILGLNACGFAVAVG
ncbi:hypothetical protein B0H34DRAFT_541583 [Crassisporium funariophilum]|nr:hypothetical protein B0H34DRAFT_541583 [Crassisporium funariophilum]